MYSDVIFSPFKGKLYNLAFLFSLIGFVFGSLIIFVEFVSFLNFTRVSVKKIL